MASGCEIYIKINRKCEEPSGRRKIARIYLMMRTSVDFIYDDLPMLFLLHQQQLLLLLLLLYRQSNRCMSVSDTLSVQHGISFSFSGNDAFYDEIYLICTDVHVYLFVCLCQNLHVIPNRGFRS